MRCGAFSFSRKALLSNDLPHNFIGQRAKSDGVCPLNHLALFTLSGTFCRDTNAKGGG